MWNCLFNCQLHRFDLKNNRLLCVLWFKSFRRVATWGNRLPEGKGGQRDYRSSILGWDHCELKRCPAGLRSFPFGGESNHTGRKTLDSICVPFHLELSQRGWEKRLPSSSNDSRSGRQDSISEDLKETPGCQEEEIPQARGQFRLVLMSV